MMRTLVIAISFLSFFIAACHPTRKPTSAKKAGSQVEQAITDTHWKLIELGGREVATIENPSHEPFLILHAADNRASGNSGCNNFNGTYELSEGNRISFSPMMSTRMACPDMQLEDELMKVFESVDSYALNADTLSLNRARMAPLARFIEIGSKPAE